MTVDGSIGFRGAPGRRLQFCLLHFTKALCGDGFPLDEGTTLSDALRILRSIEFIGEALQEQRSITPHTSVQGQK